MQNVAKLFTIYISIYLIYIYISYYICSIQSTSGKEPRSTPVIFSTATVTAEASSVLGAWRCHPDGRAGRFRRCHEVGLMACWVGFFWVPLAHWLCVYQYSINKYIDININVNINIYISVWGERERNKVRQDISTLVFLILTLILLQVTPCGRHRSTSTSGAEVGRVSSF